MEVSGSTKEPLSVSHSALWVWWCPLDPAHGSHYIPQLDNSRLISDPPQDVIIQLTFHSKNTKSKDSVSILPESAQVSALTGVWAGFPLSSPPHGRLSV